jgi:hypothetical protein
MMMITDNTRIVINYGWAALMERQAVRQSRQGAVFHDATLGGPGGASQGAFSPINPHLTASLTGEGFAVSFMQQRGTL